jgi:hypothetical protein
MYLSFTVIPVETIIKAPNPTSRPVLFDTYLLAARAATGSSVWEVAGIVSGGISAVSGTGSEISALTRISSFKLGEVLQKSPSWSKAEAFSLSTGLENRNPCPYSQLSGLGAAKELVLPGTEQL